MSAVGADPGTSVCGRPVEREPAAPRSMEGPPAVLLGAITLLGGGAGGGTRSPLYGLVGSFTTLQAGLWTSTAALES